MQYALDMTIRVCDMERTTLNSITMVMHGLTHEITDLVIAERSFTFTGETDGRAVRIVIETDVDIWENIDFLALSNSSHSWFGSEIWIGNQYVNWMPLHIKAGNGHEIDPTVVEEDSVAVDAAKV